MKHNGSKKLNLEPLIVRSVVGTFLLVSIILFILGMNTENIMYCAAGTLLLVIDVLISYRSMISLSRYDSLSGVYNSDAIVLRAVRLMIFKRLAKYNFAFMNICDLKYVNSVYGSIAGDNAIRAYAQSVRNGLDRSERVGRLGGDNFVVLFKKSNTDKFLRMLDSVSVTINVDGRIKKLSLKTRVGLYDIGPHDKVGDIIANANNTLKILKDSRNGYVLWYTPEMGTAIAHDKKVTYLFDKALANGEFTAYYQPRVNAVTNTLCGAEALARWIKKGEVVPPYQFIPPLENSGLVSELDFYIFEQVCKNVQKWKQEGKKLVPVSSNFSKNHLHNDDFAARIIEILSKYDVDKSLIELELTESSRMEDFHRLNDFLAKMNEAGITVAIDDFGVGYSSLELLKNRNFKIVKIDKSFIDNIETDGGNNINYRLMQNIVSTCKNMNKHMVCEGVETKEQKELLMELGCEEIQGYLYDRPMPLDAFEERLSNNIYEA